MPVQAANGILNFSYRELVILMIKEARIHEGLWMPNVEFRFQGTNMAMNGDDTNDMRPTVQVQISQVGLMPSPTANPLTVDAAAVNPRPNFVRPTLAIPPAPQVVAQNAA